MKKVLTVLFSLICAVSVYGLDFEFNIDKCLRDILNKQDGEITSTDLNSIKEFYCYSNISLESFKILVDNLSDGTRITIGQEGEEGYIEGLIRNGKFISGYFLDNGLFLPGIRKGEKFNPGYYDFKKEQFTHGLYLDDRFVHGAIIYDRFEAGIFHNEIFLGGSFVLNRDDMVVFEENGFREIIGYESFGISQDEMLSLGRMDLSLWMNGNNNLFLTKSEAIKMWNDGRDIAHTLENIATPLLFFPKVGVPVNVGIKIAGVLGPALAIGIVYTWDKFTKKDDKPEKKTEEKPEKKTEKTKNTKKKVKKTEKKEEDKEKEKKNKNEDDDDKDKKKKKKDEDDGCESPYTENSSGSGIIGGGTSKKKIKLNKGDIDYLEEDYEVTESASSTNKKVFDKGDIDWGEGSSENDIDCGKIIVIEKFNNNIIFDPGTIDPGNCNVKIGR